jgi:hypothetical protein
MNRLFAFAALLLITSVASAGTITTTLDENTPGGAPAGIMVFDINILNTDNWVGTELTYTADGAGVSQNDYFDAVAVDGIAPPTYDANYDRTLDTFFMFPGAVQHATLVVAPSFMPAPFNMPATTGDLKVGWYDTGNTLKGSYKIGQLALSVPEGEWTIASEANGQVIGELIVTSRVKEGDSIAIEQQTLLVTEVPEPTTALLALFGLLALVPFARRK